MECIPGNHIFEFGLNTLQTIRKEFGLDKPGDMARAINILEEWITQQIHFQKKAFPRNYLEKCIIANKGSVERTKQKLDKMCTFRTLMPHFFGDNLTKNDFSDIDDLINVMLPKQTDQNFRVYVLKNIGKKFNFAQILNYYRYMILICEYIIAHDYNNGIVILVDYTETNLMELIKSLNLVELRQIMTIITDGIGMRLKGIHFMTSSKTIEMFLTIFKQMLSEKVANRIHVHNQIDTVYSYIPRDILPEEYGGMEQSLLALRKTLLNTLTSNDFRSYIEDMNEAKTNEACRQSDKFNDQYIGMSGTFRTLNVD